MSVRREVLSLSQLLRRNENSNSHRSGRAPPLPLQTSRHRAERTIPAKEIHSGIRHARSEPFTERPARSGNAPMSCTQRKRVSTSQPELDKTTNSFTALLQDAYEVESQQSAVTSMSQSSFSQTQSQNLLSQDDQILHPQRWQVQQVPPQSPSTSAHDHCTQKLRELELNLTKSFHEQTQKQEQQHELMVSLVYPVKRSVEEIKARLVTSGETQQQLGMAIENLTQKVDGLRQQSLNNDGACQETHKVVASEAAAVKAALRELQAKVETVEARVKSCSGLISKAHQGEAAKQDALLSAVAASSCKCVEVSIGAGDFPDTDRAMRKRQRRLGSEQVGCNFSSPVQRPPKHTRTQSPPHYVAGITVSYESDDDDITGKSLNVSLQRIQNLLDKRREYLHDH